MRILARLHRLPQPFSIAARRRARCGRRKLRRGYCHRRGSNPQNLDGRKRIRAYPLAHRYFFRPPLLLSVCPIGHHVLTLATPIGRKNRPKLLAQATPRWPRRPVGGTRAGITGKPAGRSVRTSSRSPCGLLVITRGSLLFFVFARGWRRLGRRLVLGGRVRSRGRLHRRRGVRQGFRRSGFAG
jgi:hypothetical protein